MALDVDDFKQGQRSTWAAGDYPDVARTIEQAAHTLLDRLGVEDGMDMLDVATGTGNVAIPAARSGARVSGLDLTPQLLEVARERAEQTGVQVSWVEGDAEQLPFADGSFDRVSSCFGVIFAPRHRIATSELVRVTRPGGRVAVAAWTPEGLQGGFFRAVGSYMPPPPPELVSPLRWGEEEYVRSLFADAAGGAQISHERATVTFEGESTDAFVGYLERALGPLARAKPMLQEQGRWDQLRAELVALYEEGNEARDGSLRVQGEYLITVAQLPA
jgi:SAM-dependent methyltransferase